MYKDIRQKYYYYKIYEFSIAEDGTQRKALLEM